MGAVAVLNLTGCSDTLDQHYTQVGDSDNITIIDLRSQLKNKLLVAQATFHNSDSDAVTGYYRCQFSDANGMRVGNSQTWQPITIYPNEDQVIKCLATDVEATNFKAEFSEDGQNISVQKQASS